LIDEAPAAHKFAMEIGSQKMKELKGYRPKPEYENLFGNHAIFMGKKLSLSLIESQLQERNSGGDFC
jgi:hypothetical protein